MPIVVVKRKGARRIVLRYQPLAHAVSLTLPRYVTIEQGLGFVDKKRDWVLTQMEKRAPLIAFEDGQTIPVLGQNYRLRHVGGRGVVRPEEAALLVPGGKEFMPRRVREWLKTQAREGIATRAEAKAKILGVRIAKVSLRDTRSLWGSCNRKGNLSFSWRLILAPEDVLDYVVAHEVAHLKELNHSERFWRVVETLCPHWQASRRWLKKHGDTLYRYR